jgi:hypothetical protein
MSRVTDHGYSILPSPAAMGGQYPSKGDMEHAYANGRRFDRRSNGYRSRAKAETEHDPGIRARDISVIERQVER